MRAACELQAEVAGVCEPGGADPTEGQGEAGWLRPSPSCSMSDPSPKPPGRRGPAWADAATSSGHQGALAARLDLLCVCGRVTPSEWGCPSGPCWALEAPWPGAAGWLIVE